MLHGVLGLQRMTVHGMHHTHATLLHHKGVDVVEIQHQLGHREVRVTIDMYVNPTDGSRRSAADTLEDALRERGGEGEGS